MTIKKLTLMAVVAICSLHLRAQSMENPGRASFEMEYTTELQTDFDKVKSVNLLRTDLSLKLAGFGSHEISLNAATLSTAQTNEDPLINDLQGFSNIEAENISLTLAVLSLDWNTKNTTLAIGVRNFNENYFATDLTSFFTQSSHGIFPTISANFPIANYPVSSLGMDFQWRIKTFTLNASLYNGIGYKNLTGHESIFRFRPKTDGIFSAIQLSHEAGYGNSNAGIALYNNSEKIRATYWTYGEFNLTDRTQLLIQYSFAPGKDMECRHYSGLGIKQTIGRIDIGIAEIFAQFTETGTRNINEWATELTACLPIAPSIIFQPVIHLCYSDMQTNFVGLLRLIVRL